MKRNYLNITAAFLAALAIGLSSCEKEDDDGGGDDTSPTEASNVVTVKDHTGTTTWSNDSVYKLEGFVFVEDGQTLTIEPGTMIQGKPGQGENASALIVARGGTIQANGTEDDPIIFTAEGDNRSGDAYGKKERGLWGGVLILGKATTNNSQPLRVEGIPEGEKRAIYGGNNDEDNSGTFKYVQIRHGGTDIGAGNEINGLTLAAVGSKTEIHHVEVIANMDDGVEWFGGNANTHHLLVSYCGDDGFDYDQGFHGKGQFWTVVQAEDNAGRLGEHDGGDGNETGKPYAKPTIYNATYIGQGSGNRGDAIIFRDNAGGTYANSIFANQDGKINFEYRSDKTNSYKRLTEGDLEIKDCIFSNIAQNDTLPLAIANEKGNISDEYPDYMSTLEKHFEDNNNEVNKNLNLSSADLKVVPASGANNGTAPPDDGFFEDVTYQGAFDPNGENWAKGWTLTFQDQ